MSRQCEETINLNSDPLEYILLDFLCVKKKKAQNSEWLKIQLQLNKLSYLRPVDKKEACSNESQEQDIYVIESSMEFLKLPLKIT